MDTHLHELIIAGHFHEDDTYSIKRPNGMDDWLITYTIDGEGYFRVGDKEQRVTSGDVAIVKANTPHQYGTPEGMKWNFVWAHFGNGLMDSNLLPTAGLNYQHVEQHASRERIQQAFRRILFDFREQGHNWHELCLGALREIFILFARQQNSGLDPRVEETLHLLAENMNHTFRIEELASKVGLSGSRLSHLFKEQTGDSIIEALNRMRVKQAALLLTHTNLNATEAADNVGFQNYNHFTKQFRKYIGMTPRHFSRKD
ncbi:helix-turn-helix domain-containing protein [Alkalicoccobacillus porphyridii]|uniref:Helix-turn-helix domain-containing protein n=1 Tax=Alkalicoccobacillus porphyridii TaxID=2597270 RepID=A0A554A2B5_9BACI|nr:helix-turn-helix domain-containing protein [Alkalicoccobacillus porphyridii]TSB47832.1 helix-turn-helix domain-containing protein [Alkalicoccobacillus porphyridii]